MTFSHRPIMRWLTTSLSLACVSLAYPCLTNAASCLVLDPPKIDIEIRRGEVQEVVDTSSDELAQIASAAGAQDHLPAFGRYTASLGYKVDFDTHVERSGDGTFCAVPRSLHVTIVLTNRVIHLARETQTSSCLLQATLGHLRRHAFADEEMLDERIATLQDELRAAIMQTPLNGAQSAMSARGALTDVISKQIAAAFIGLEKSRRELNWSIDSPANLAKLHAACGAQDSQGL